MTYQNGIMSPKVLFRESAPGVPDYNAPTAATKTFARNQQAQVVAPGELFQRLTVLVDRQAAKANGLRRAAKKHGVTLQTVHVDDPKAKTLYTPGTLIHTSDPVKGDRLGKLGYNVVSQPNDTPHYIVADPATNAEGTDLDRALCCSKVEQVFNEGVALTKATETGLTGGILAAHGYTIKHQHEPQAPGPVMGWVKGRIATAERVNKSPLAPYEMKTEAWTARGEAYVPYTHANLRAHGVKLDKVVHLSGQSKETGQKGLAIFYDDHPRHVATAEKGAGWLVHPHPDGPRPGAAAMQDYIKIGLHDYPHMEKANEPYLAQEKVDKIEQWVATQPISDHAPPHKIDHATLGDPASLPRYYGAKDAPADQDSQRGHIKRSASQTDVTVAFDAPPKRARRSLATHA